MRKLILATVLGATASYMTPAHALLFTLNQDGSTGSTVFGTIDVQQGPTATSVTVTETLAAGVRFVSTGAGQALEFSLAGNPALTISGLSSGFSVGPTSARANPFGTFGYSITCSGCGNGASGPLAGPLTFTATDGLLSPASFVANASGFFFASNVIGPTGNAGNVAAQGSGGNSTSIPEPASMALLGTGLTILGVVRHRRQKTKI